MIEVRIDLDSVKKLDHEVLENIKIVERLRAAGIPFIGRLVLSGVTHGTLIHHVDEDIDGDTLVYRWYDRGEISESVLNIAYKAPRAKYFAPKPHDLEEEL